jgi:hypothetical protein
MAHIKAMEPLSVAESGAFVSRDAISCGIAKPAYFTA